MGVDRTEWLLPEDGTVAGAARARVAEYCVDVGLSEEIGHDLALVASELAANAVRHGQPPVLLAVEQLGDRVRVTVVDHGNAGDPQVVTAHDEAGSGRGLAIVDRLADAVGWHREGDRLEVWAEVRT